jgi:deazaflavin-dependent oxidoreductase (nitroreductase family)
MADDDNFNDKIIAEFRANAGKVGGYFDGQTLLLLHTTGVKSGAERINPLVYQPVGDSYAIFGSAGGGPKDPQWYRNLLANPATTVEVGTGTVTVRARKAGAEERARIWAKQMSDLENFAGYEKTAAPREIPVIILDPVA